MLKNIINYIKYRKFIEENREYLINEFNIKIDRLYRLGSRISIPDNRYQVLMNYKNSQLDVYKNLDEETKKFINRLDRFFMKMNVNELFGLYSADRTDVNEVIVIISYKKLNIVKFANINRIIFIISFLSLSLGFIDLLYMIPGGFLMILYYITNKLLFKKPFV